MYAWRWVMSVKLFRYTIGMLSACYLHMIESPAESCARCSPGTSRIFAYSRNGGRVRARSRTAVASGEPGARELRALVGRRSRILHGANRHQHD